MPPTALRLADEAALDLYCRRVAGSVGAMAVRIFGAPEAEGFGLALGRTFQLVNILRDVDEDAARDRVYVPRTLLAAHGVADGAGDGDRRASRLRRHLRARWPRRREAGFARARGGNRAASTRRALLPARGDDVGLPPPASTACWRAASAAPRARPRLTAGEKLRMAAYALRLAPVGAR